MSTNEVVDKSTLEQPKVNLETAKPVKEEKPAASVETKKSSNDDDLDDLDDLLDDFADDVLSKPPGASVSQRDDQSIKHESDKAFEDLVKQFETNHRESVEAEEKKPANFEYVMKETMERLKKLGDDIDAKFKNDPLGSNPEDLLTQLLSGMGDAGDGDFDMSKLLVDMLEQLSSKEVLYEPIKDLNTKFPEYLQQNKDKLDEAKYKNYTQQYEITNDIVKIFELESYSEENKRQREQVNSLLESLQELGQPPSELVGETGDFLPGFGGGAGKGGDNPFGFDEKDLPPEFGKDLQEGCKQQ